MRIIAIDHSIIDAVFQTPLTAGGIILVSDDTARETVGAACFDLTAHKGSVYQILLILFGLVHTDDTAGTDADGLGFIVQEPFSGYTAVQAARGTVVSGDTAQVTVAEHPNLQTAGGDFSATAVA